MTPVEGPAEGGNRDERLVVALVRSLHGLRGAVRVEILTDRPEERFRPGQVLFREGDTAPLSIESAAAVADGPGWRLRFRELSDRTAAESLRGAYLEIAVRPAAELARGEVYWHEMLGVTVSDTDGRALGTVRDVYRAGGAEVLVVKGGPVGEFDVPVVRAFVRIFAPRRGEIVVDAAALDLPPGPERSGATERSP
jgi:16S rRNA processing protein RimM